MTKDKPNKTRQFRVSIVELMSSRLGDPVLGRLCEGGQR